MPCYHAFYSFSRQKEAEAGYSGTVTLEKIKIPVIDAEEGLSGVWTQNKQANEDLTKRKSSSTLPTPSIGGNIDVFDDFVADNEILKDVDRRSLRYH